MANSDWIETTMTIAKREVHVRHGTMAQSELRFYVDNPRIYSIVHASDEKPTQIEIEERLKQMDHVKQLIQSIRANGGLIDPLIVRDGDFVVLEGNSRLAAYRVLAVVDPIAWGRVKVTLLPENVPERLIFALLGEYHIIGRQDWQPYEQAGYLYRRISEHRMSPQTIAHGMGLSIREVNRLTEVFEFMLTHEEDEVSRWSYYEEYLRPRVSKQARARHPSLDSVVVEKIRSREIERAIDVREKLVKVLRGGDKSIRILLSGPNTLERALVSAADRGAENPWLRRLKQWRTQLSSENVGREFQEMKEEHRKQAKFQIGKIEQRLKRIRRELE